MTPAAAQREQRQRGFTLVEVTVSLGIMMIGAMALFGMQQQATRANVHARQLTVATQIAQTWIERIKLDGMRWVTMTGDPEVDLLSTEFLRTVATTGAPTSGIEGVFTTLVLSQTHRDAGMSNGFDYYGRDVPDLDTNMADVRYCASYRLTWVYWDRNGFGANPVPTDDRALRVDVRVWWPKERIVNGPKTTGNDLATDFADCADDDTALNPPVNVGTPTEFDNYHIVYLSTVVRPT
jgi:type II secretory pathway pseudopilin PulG